MADVELESLLGEQIAYYRARADEYDSTYPLDVHADAVAGAELLTTLERLAPFGTVLELACGTGQWTVELARHAERVTAVDAAPEALAICRRRVGAAQVQLVEADLFTWRPLERYDFVRHLAALGIYVRLGEETSARITAENDEHHRRHRR